MSICQSWQFLPWLCRGGWPFALLGFGEEERAAFESAAGGDGQLPVGALFGQAVIPGTALWAP
jgi:hypothetical protein